MASTGGSSPTSTSSWRSAALCTSDSVLVECLDRSRQENLDLTARLAEWWVRALEEHHLEVLRQDEVARRRALVSRLKYRSDSRISYVDCTIAALIERHGVRELLSGDPHFRLLCPGARLLPEDDEAGRG